MTDDPERGPAPSEAPPPYTRYRARPQFRRAPTDGRSMLGDLRQESGRSASGHKPITAGRVFKWIALAVGGWLALSLMLFLISAQIRAGDVNTGGTLDSAGPMPFSANTTLVLGSDQRPKGSKEAGANVGPSRADSIMLMRVGGGQSSALSIPRDTVVNIPGHGLNKINAAFAIGGVPLMISTVKAYLGVSINHVILVDFANFPGLVDAMGGVDYTGPCVFAKINGGYANGGVTLHIKRGTTHLDGKQALALARVRKNTCHPSQDDLDRAKRQQLLVGAMKSQVLSIGGFIRLPLIAWNTPTALKTDMGGPTLLGLFTSLGLFGTPAQKVLKPDGAITLPDGGAGLTVSPASKRRQVKQFENG